MLKLMVIHFERLDLTLLRIEAKVKGDLFD
jgi:hypothetical protein